MMNVKLVINISILQPFHLLYLDVDYFSDYDVTQNLTECCSCQQVVSDFCLKEPAHVIPVHRGKDETHPDRSGRQNVPRQTSLGRESPHFTHDFEPLADDVRKIGEDFCQIASCLFLHQNSCDEEFQIQQRHPIYQIEKGLF